MRNFRLYFFTLAAIIGSVFFIIPNLSNNPAHYNFEVETLKQTRIETKEIRRRLKMAKEKTLILKMESGNEWAIGKKRKTHWKKLTRKENIGKTFKLYTEKNTHKHRNPGRIEIENEIIYDFNSRNTYQYFILALTVILIILSAISLKKKRKG